MSMASVVVVDDSSSVVEMVSELLADEGFEVLGTAPDGDAGLELISRVQPDIALVDLNMPGLSGVALTRKIVAAFPKVMVVILTGVADYGVVDECLTAGAFHYLVKDEAIMEVGPKLVAEWDEYRQKHL